MSSKSVLTLVMLYNLTAEAFVEVLTIPNSVLPGSLYAHQTVQQQASYHILTALQGYCS